MTNSEKQSEPHEENSGWIKEQDAYLNTVEFNSNKIFLTEKYLEAVNKANRKAHEIKQKINRLNDLRFYFKVRESEGCKYFREQHPDLIADLGDYTDHEDLEEELEEYRELRETAVEYEQSLSNFYNDLEQSEKLREGYGFLSETDKILEEAVELIDLDCLKDLNKLPGWERGF